MKNMFDQLGKFTLLKTVVYILLGLLIVFNPDLVFNGITYIISGYLAVTGLMNIFQAIRNNQGNSFVNSSFIFGSMNLLFAVIILFFAKQIASFFPVLAGILIVLNGLLQFGATSGIREVNPRFRVGTMIYSGILVVAGLFFIFKPFASLTILFQFFGGMLIFMGVSEISAYFILKRNKGVTRID